MNQDDVPSASGPTALSEALTRMRRLYEGTTRCDDARTLLEWLDQATERAVLAERDRDEWVMRAHGDRSEAETQKDQAAFLQNVLIVRERDLAAATERELALREAHAKLFARIESVAYAGHSARHSSSRSWRECQLSACREWRAILADAALPTAAQGSREEWNDR